VDSRKNCRGNGRNSGQKREHNRHNPARVQVFLEVEHFKPLSETGTSSSTSGANVVPERIIAPQLMTVK
jgi:hypothetical protein